jgi:DNA-binding transcriptional MerR regulator
MDANTVGAVAALTGVSVRTLHHYDHIGLVVPSVRTPAGYRGYTDADIERLHLVLVYRRSPASSRNFIPARSLASSGEHRTPRYR